jgi:hypothetical protein
MKRRFILGALIFSTCWIMANPTGDWEPVSNDELVKVFNDCETQFNSSGSFQVNVSHESFKDHKTIQREDISKGYYLKDKNHYHSFLVGVHTIQNDKLKLSVDTSERIILVMLPEKTEGFMNENKSLMIAQNIQSSSKMRKGGETLYKVVFKPNAGLEFYELAVDEKKVVKKLTLYYSTAIPQNPDDVNSPKSKPRVEITFSGFIINPTVNYAESFSENKYLKKAGESYEGTGIYADYEVNDLRKELTNQKEN